MKFFFEILKIVSMSFHTAEVICQEMLSQRECKFLKKADNYLVYLDPDDTLIYVFFDQVSKLNISNVKDYIKLMEKDLITHGIIIHNSCVTASAKKVIMNVIHMNIELFDVQDLQFNITKHRLYRPHISLPSSEREEFVRKFGDKIPIIQRTDPVCAFFNFKKGTILKIIRKDNFISYRIVK